MFASLKMTLEDCGAAQEDGFSHLITDTPYVSSTPLLVYHLLNSLNNGKSVCFLSFQNTWSHYCNICNKIGVNLRSKSNEDAVHVLELMKFFPQIITKTCTNDIFNFLVNDVEYTLKELYNYVKTEIERLKMKESGVTLIIDSVTPLLNLGVSEKEVEIFIQYCFNLLDERKDKLVISCMEIESSNLLVNRLAHRCSILVGVQGLSTGGSKDIQGELSVWKKFGGAIGVKKHIKYHYKVEERDVKVFPVGFASKTL